MSEKREIRRYRCIRECAIDEYEGDGFPTDGGYGRVTPGSIWREAGLGGWPPNYGVRLDREDVEPDVGEWCAPTCAQLAAHFDRIESAYE